MATGDLTTLSAVKAYLGIEIGETEGDKLLNSLISSESARFVGLVGRDIAQKTYTETFDGNDPRIRARPVLTPFPTSTMGASPMIGTVGWAFNPLQFPIISITSLTINGTAVPVRPSLDGDGYVIIENRRIELVGYSFTTGVGNATLVYVAGYATIPADVDRAVAQMVAFEFRKRDRLGQRSKSVGGETISFVDDWLPEEVITAYRRIPV